MRLSVSPLDALHFPSLRSESEKVACVSWSINWSWFCLRLPGRLAALMKLLNEAERGHLCSHPDDHACRWHGRRRWHLGANYTDFTPARVWISLFWVMDGCWGTSHPNRATSGPWGPEVTDSKVNGKQIKKSGKKKNTSSYPSLLRTHWDQVTCGSIFLLLAPNDHQYSLTTG